VKKHSSFSHARLFVLLGLLFGALLVAVSLMPYEVLADAVGGLAPDGRVESFTEARFEAWSRLFRVVGIIVAFVFAGALFFPQKVGVVFNVWRDWIGGFWKQVRADAKVFWRETRQEVGSRSGILLILFVTLMAVVIRMADLFIPMEHDEAYTYNAFASFPLWHVISDYHLPNNHVLLTIFISILNSLFGNHLWLFRLPSLIAGVCMVPAAYWLARRLYDNETAVLSAVFVAFFPILVKYSVLARGYVFVSLFTLWTFWIGDYVRTNRNYFGWLMLAVLSALGFYVIPIMLFPFGALYLWLLMSCIVGDIASYRSTWDFLKFHLTAGIAAAFLTVILYSPILLNPSNRLFGNTFIAPVGWDEYPSAIWFRLQNAWADWTSTIPNWLIVLGVAGVLLSLVLHRKINKHKVPLQVAFLLWIVFLVVARRPDMETRMWTFLAAPSLIWSAGGLVGSLKLTFSRSGWNRQTGRLFSAVVLAVSLVYTASILPSIPARWQAKGSVESSVIVLKDRLREGDMVATSAVFVPQLRYYLEVYGIPLTYLRQPEGLERAFVLVRSVDGSASAGDTLEVVAPKNTQGQLAIDPATAVILLQYEDLALYECYPLP